MTKGEAINALYAVFNAPHNADINIVYLNKILDDLIAAERERLAKTFEGAGGVNDVRDIAAGIRARG